MRPVIHTSPDAFSCRLLGVFGTLEELYAGDDWQAEKARAAAAVRRSLKGTQAVTLAPSVGYS